MSEIKTCSTCYYGTPSPDGLSCYCNDPDRKTVDCVMHGFKHHLDKEQGAELEHFKNAVRVVHDYCTKHNCGECPFGYDAGKECALDCIPEQWELSSERVTMSECGTVDKTATHTATWVTQTMSDISGWNNSLTGGHDSVAGHYCSYCKQETFISDVGDEILSPYCPNCGAKMNESTTPKL